MTSALAALPSATDMAARRLPAASGFCRGRCGTPAAVPCYVDGCAVFTTVRRAAGVAFWPAEEYHQNYFARHPSQPYCVFVVAPKVQKFRDHFLAKLKK